MSTRLARWSVLSILIMAALVVPAALSGCAQQRKFVSSWQHPVLCVGWHAPGFTG